MPIHVYHCDACGAEFDRLQKLSDPDPESCPHCGRGGGIRRKVSAPAFRLAGRGWYETDFKSDKEKKHNLADSGKPATDEAGGQPASAEKPRQTAKAGKAGGEAAKPAPMAGE